MSRGELEGGPVRASSWGESPIESKSVVARTLLWPVFSPSRGQRRWRDYTVSCCCHKHAIEKGSSFTLGMRTKVPTKVPEDRTPHGRRRDGEKVKDYPQLSIRMPGCESQVQAFIDSRRAPSGDQYGRDRVLPLTAEPERRWSRSGGRRAHVQRDRVRRRYSHGEGAGAATVRR